MPREALMPAVEKLLEHANHSAVAALPDRTGPASLELGPGRERRHGTFILA